MSDTPASPPPPEPEGPRKSAEGMTASELVAYLDQVYEELIKALARATAAEAEVARLTIERDEAIRLAYERSSGEFSDADAIRTIAERLEMEAEDVSEILGAGEEL